jgi:hypothetical protein
VHLPRTIFVNGHLQSDFLSCSLLLHRQFLSIQESSTWRRYDNPDPDPRQHGTQEGNPSEDALLWRPKYSILKGTRSQCRYSQLTRSFSLLRRREASAKYIIIILDWVPIMMVVRCSASSACFWFFVSVRTIALAFGSLKLKKNHSRGCHKIP